MLNKKSISEYITPLSPIPTTLKQKGILDEKIECVMFDIYGTLFISGSGDISIQSKKQMKTDSLDKLLVKYGICKPPQALLKDLFSGIKKKHMEQRKKGVDFPEVEIDHIWMDVLKNNNRELIKDFALEFELIVNPLYSMPNLRELLSGCRDLKILIGIISNAQFYTPYLFNWFFDSDLKDLGFSPDLIFFSYTYGYAKPSMFLFEVATEKLNNKGIKAQSVLYVGNDMLNDIYPAKKAGFKTALFAGDSRSLRLRKNVPECENISPDIIITDLIQVLDYIQ